MKSFSATGFIGPTYSYGLYNCQESLRITLVYRHFQESHPERWIQTGERECSHPFSFSILLYDDPVFTKGTCVMKQYPTMTRLMEAGLAISLTAWAPMVAAQTDQMRTLPARTIPTPTTVSPKMQKVISAWTGSNSAVSLTNKQWKATIQQTNEIEEKSADSLKKQFNVTVEQKTVAGVKVYSVKPEVIAEENRRRLLVHLHGGGYVFLWWRSRDFEAILMAHYGKIEVISVDYRMPPEFPSSSRLR